jgi:hypothetical protein
MATTKKATTSRKRTARPSGAQGLTTKTTSRGQNLRARRPAAKARKT